METSLIILIICVLFKFVQCDTDDQIFQAVNEHGDRLYDLENAFKTLKNQVNALTAENGALKKEVKVFSFYLNDEVVCNLVYRDEVSSNSLLTNLLIKTLN